MDGSRMARRSWLFAVTFGVILQVGGTAWASSLSLNETYSTMGTVGTTGVSGIGVLNFQGITDGNLATGSSFDLGQFVAAPTSAKTITEYTGTPFQVTLQILTDGTDPPPPGGYAPVVINGTLSGTVRGVDASGLQVTYDLVPIPTNNPYPLTIPTFQTGSLTNFLVINNGIANNPFGGTLNVQQEVPEPSSLVVFGCLIGWMVRHRSRRKSKVAENT